MRYYVEGKYGIRIENLIIVRDAEKIDGGNVETLSFETITLCPVDRRLIDARMLSPFEKDWLNNYHERLRTTLGEYLNGTELEWLEAATQPI